MALGAGKSPDAPDDAVLTETGLAPAQTGRVLLIACGGLAHEILAVKAANSWNHLDLQCLPAKLHLWPDRITASVEQAVLERRDDYASVLVVYADCGTGGQLQEKCKELGVEIIEGPHCYSFFEGNAVLDRVLHSTVVQQALMAYALLHLLVVEWFARKAGKGYRIAIGALLVMSGVIFITANYGDACRALSISFANTVDLGLAPYHLLALTLMVIAVVRVALLARDVIHRPSTGWTMYLWMASIFIVILASQELDLIMMQAQGTTLTLNDARRVGYPILWGVGSFAFMWYGMRARLRTMRMIAHSLFALTLVKLFLFDLEALSEGGAVWRPSSSSARCCSSSRSCTSGSKASSSTTRSREHHRPMLRKRDLTLFPLLCAGTLLAQQAKWSASVPMARASGLQAIRLSPELLGAARRVLF